MLFIGQSGPWYTEFMLNDETPFEELSEVEKLESRALVMVNNANFGEPDSYLAVMPEGVVLRIDYAPNPDVNDGWIEMDPRYLGVLRNESLESIREYIVSNDLLELEDQGLTDAECRELYINYAGESLRLYLPSWGFDGDRGRDVIDEVDDLIDDLLENIEPRRAGKYEF